MLQLYSNIKLRREALGIRQEDLAAAAGYSNKSAIARIEQGAIDLPASKIVAIAKALKTTPGALLDGDFNNAEFSILADYRDADKVTQENAALLLHTSAETKRAADKKAEWA